MHRTITVAGIILMLGLAGCSNSSPNKTTTTEPPKQQAAPTPTPAAVPTTKAATNSAQGCLRVPPSFFAGIGVRGQVVRSGAVKSAVTDALGRDVYEVAAKFSDGTVAVWSEGRQLVGGGPTFPMNAAARKHSDQGVDAPASALPDDPGGVAAAAACVG
jgi:hypothetical protein